MLTQAATATLRILLFRAGPQDFPYSPRLTRVLLPVALLVNYAVLAVALPSAALAVIMAAAMVIGMGIAVRSVLRLRSLDSRYTQTYHALLSTSATLTLVLILPMAQIAPELRALAENPQLLDQGPSSVRLPTGPTVMINLLNLWNFAVTAHIFRHAAGVRLWVGGLVALAVSGALLLFVVFTSSVLGALLGVAPTAPAP